MALAFYTSFAEDLADAGLDWVADDLRLALMTNTYAFSAAHAFRAALTNEIATGNGYTTGGLALDTKTATAANPCVMTAADEVVAQNAAGFTTARKYTLLKWVGTAATDPLIANGTAVADFGNQAGQLTLDYPASFLTITLA